MATAQALYTAQEAATELGVTDARVRQLCIESKGGIGKKHGKMWLLTEADLLRIRQLASFGKKAAG